MKKKLNRNKTYRLTDSEISHVIEMAWSDIIHFDSIQYQLGLSEKDVIGIMKRNLKRSSFIMWRKRVSSQVSKKHKRKINSNFNLK